MKDLLLSVRVVVENLKLEISACRFADYVKKCYSTKLRGARAARLFFLIQPITSLLPGVSLCCCRSPCLISDLQIAVRGRLRVRLFRTEHML